VHASPDAHARQRLVAAYASIQAVHGLPTPSSLLVARVDKAGGRRRPRRWARVKELPQSHSRTKKKALARCPPPANVGRTARFHRNQSHSSTPEDPGLRIARYRRMPTLTGKDKHDPANDGSLGILVALGAQRPRFPCRASLSLILVFAWGVMCGLIDRRLGSTVVIDCPLSQAGWCS
jgi:hypothetical protein